MTSEHLLNTLVLIERSYDINSWRADDVLIWPLVRIELASRMILSELSRERGQTFSSRSHRYSRPRIATYLRRVVDLAKYPPARKALDSARPSEIVLLGEADAIINSESGSSIHRTLSPIQKQLTELNHSSTLMIYRRIDRRHLPSDSRMLQPILDLAAITTAKYRKPAHVMTGFDSAMKLVAQMGYADSTLSEGEVQTRATRLLTWANLLESLISDSKLVVVSDYYSLQGMAAVLACRRRQIPSMDLQHGVAGPLHPAYDRWTRVPHHGYELLPDWFWAWGDADQRTIHLWSESCERHKSIVGGIPRFDVDQTGSDMRRSAIPVIMYAATIDENPTDSSIVEIIRTLPKYRWIIRRHPLSGAKDNWEKIVLSLPTVDIRIHNANQEALQDVLAQVDLVVTRFSSVILEASDLGIRSVFIDERGAELYSHVGHGVLDGTANPSDTIRRIIESGAETRLNPLSQHKSALCEILDVLNVS